MNNIFCICIESDLLIREIIENFRKQNFFVGSLKLRQLVNHINSIAETIYSNLDCNELAEELDQILPALL
jgi:hypothetical protein